ncbi:hypothetical protein C8J57DRAFT_1084428, partial [Mycena rebaudengoi]
LGYLQYISHFARAALNSSLELAAQEMKCWARDLILASSKLPFACPDLVNASPDSILAYATSVLKWIQGEVNSSDKLYLIQGHLHRKFDAYGTTCSW